MEPWKYYLYRLTGFEKKTFFNISPDPHIDFAYYKQIHSLKEPEITILAGPMMLGTADFFRVRIHERDDLDQNNNSREYWETIFSQFKKSFSDAGLSIYNDYIFYFRSLKPKKRRIPSSKEEDIVLNLLQGRIFFHSELIKAANNNKFRIRTLLINIIQVLYLKKRLRRLPAVGVKSVTDNNLKCFCNRCGEIFEFRGIKKLPACKRCIQIGKSVISRALYSTFPVISLKKKRNKNCIKKSSIFEKGIHFSDQNGSICDSFPADFFTKNIKIIDSLLKQGRTLLIVFLSNRKAREFYESCANSLLPENDIGLLSSETYNDNSFSLLISNFYQVVRFLNHFDLVVADNCDGIAEDERKFFLRILRRSLKKNGRLISSDITQADDSNKKTSKGLNFIKRIALQFSDLLYQRKDYCSLCKNEIKVFKDKEICSKCINRLEFICEPYCYKCGRDLEETTLNVSNKYLCNECKDRNYYYNRVTAVFRYQGYIKDLIYRFKYYDESDLADPLGKLMAEAVLEKRDRIKADMIIPVPLHIGRLRERGYNQALLLSRRVGDELNIRVLPDLLARKKLTQPQSKLSRNLRFKNLEGVFEIVNNLPLQGRKVLLIDDIMTSGATINESAKILLESGAEEVNGLVLARD